MWAFFYPVAVLRCRIMALNDFSPNNMIQFTLFSRSYCHLCDDMLEQLQAYQPSHPFSVSVIDIDAEGNEAALAMYDELVPVLLGKKDASEPQKICHYFLDQDKLRAFFNGDE